MRPGWRTVAAVAVLLTCVSGFGFYSLAVYVHVLTGEGGFTLADVSRGTSLYLLSTGLAGVGAAALLARWDARLVLAGGALVMAAGLALLGVVQETWQLYGAYLLLGVGQAGAGLVPGTAVVARWFTENRGTALALASTGLSVGGIAVAPAVGLLLEVHPISVVAPVAAGAFLVLCLLAVSAVVPHPPVAGEAPPTPDGLTRGEAVRTRRFWLLSVANALAVLAQVGGLTHLYSLVAERGSVSAAGAALSCVAVGSFTGRFLGGWVLRRVPSHDLGRVLLAVQALALAVLALSSSPAVLLPSALLLGLTVGNVLLVHPLLVGDAFGLRDFPRVLSASGLVATAGVTSGPLLIGLLRSGSGSYVPGYLTAALASLVGAGLLTWLSRRTRAAPAAQRGAAALLVRQ